MFFGAKSKEKHPQKQLTLFRAPERKDFPFFSCGETPSRTVPPNQLLQVAFSLRKLAGEGHANASRRGFFGRGCDEALVSEEKGFTVKRGEAIQ